MHKNNFDFLRLLFAALVVVHHCYPISGISEQDPLYYFSNETISYSWIGVRGFFIISGYLIFQSLMRSEGITDYLIKRLLRIYPALIVVLIFTVLVCAFVYDGTFMEYLKNKSVWTYIPVNSSLIKLQHTINGVFESNPLKNGINGSLWTIGYEFSMYLFVIPLFYLKKFPRKIHVLVISVLVILLFTTRITLENQPNNLHIGVLSLNTWSDLALLFMIGAFLSVIKIESNRFRIPVLVIASVLFIALMRWEYFELSQYVLFPPIVIITGAAALKGISSIGELFGDVSYGTYIYSFPAQQLLMYYFKFNILELLLVSLPLSIFLGWLSWHLIEKHALAKKKAVYQKLKSWWQ
jgi:peptidoglycan/LPS O-acetylase OafA/YrhL